MKAELSRRSFLRKTAWVAGAAAVAGAYVMVGRAPSSRLNCVVIGCGRRGEAHIEAAAHERIVAFVDVDENRSAFALKWLADKGNLAKFKLPEYDTSKIRTYVDFRKLLDEMHRDVDAVFIATPDHNHAWLAMAAMQAGKHVYCEKPLTYDVYEARALAEAARKYKVATQMGNQGHASEDVRRLCEYIAAGAIGKVTETHSWAEAQYRGGRRPPGKPVPKGLSWDQWLGPAPYRDFHDGLLSYGWLGWWDFSAAGRLGGWGHHVLDPVFFALKPGFPASVEMVEMVPGEPEGFPNMGVIRWDFPARGDLPPFKMFWYDGVKRGTPIDYNSKEVEPDIKKEDANRPAIVEELEEKYKRNFGQNGTLFIGEAGYMHTGPYGNSPRIVPEEKHKEFKPPKKTLPRVKGIVEDFIQACKGGTPPCSNFADYSGPFTEAMLVGKLAMKAGTGRKIEWDGQNMKCTNLPELNQYVRREYRKGWTL